MEPHNPALQSAEAPSGAAAARYILIAWLRGGLSGASQLKARALAGRTMKELLRTASLSHAEGIKVALDASGIDVIVQGQALAGLLGDPFAVVVLDDGKLERARALVAQFEKPSGPA